MFKIKRIYFNVRLNVYIEKPLLKLSMSDIQNFTYMDPLNSEVG